MLRLRYGLIVLVLVACGERAAAPPATEIIARKATSSLPKTDPDNDVWRGASPHIVKLLVQDQTQPKLERGGVEAVEVRAIHDGAWIAFRLEWGDATKDDLVASARFSDMAAIQFPAEAGANLPDAAMGQLGRPVRLHLWRAVNDLLLTEDRDAIAILYPNALSDHYPFKTASGDNVLAKYYSPAVAVGNSLAVRRKDSPTEDLAAEGFGSLTTLKEQVSLGRGVHDGKRWRVVFARPLDTKPNEPIVAGARTYAAFAIWDGREKNVGSRKMRSGWVPLSIEVK